ncbi:MAG: hypothetical protein IPF69_01120 [Chitinophagaceae bacterium]|nr:hypothetical protein [Chitinophagaceae bacterium]
MRKKKIIYISNINLDSNFLPGVINKIKGQELAFKNSGFEIDLLYPGNNNIGARILTKKVGLFLKLCSITGISGSEPLIFLNV